MEPISAVRSDDYCTPAQRPLVAADRLQVSRRPMLPKQTQLQNSTLSIHMPVSTVSCLASPPSISVAAPVASIDALRPAGPAGVGIMSGLTPMSRREPTSPTAADRRKPGLERSMSHHNRGLTSASVTESCSVEAQGSLRCGLLA